MRVMKSFSRWLATPYLLGGREQLSELEGKTFAMIKIYRLFLGLVLFAPMLGLAASPVVAGSFEPAGVSGKAYHYRVATGVQVAGHANRTDRDRNAHLGAKYDRPDDRRAGQRRAHDDHWARDRRRAHSRAHRPDRHHDGQASGHRVDRHRAYKHDYRHRAHRKAHRHDQGYWHRKGGRTAGRDHRYGHRFEKSIGKHHKKLYKKKAHRRHAHPGKLNCWNMHRKVHSYGRPAVIGSTACRNRHGRTYVVPGSSYVVRYLR